MEHIINGFVNSLIAGTIVGLLDSFHRNPRLNAEGKPKNFMKRPETYVHIGLFTITIFVVEVVFKTVVEHFFRN